jgi:hypothetical protein
VEGQPEIRGPERQQEVAQDCSTRNYRLKRLQTEQLASKTPTWAEETGALTLRGVRYFVDPNQAVTNLEHVVPERPVEKSGITSL